LNRGKWFCGDKLKAEYIKFAEAWLWFSPKGKKLRKCPFSRKVKNKPEYRCKINETKPDRCRKYRPWNYGLQVLRANAGFRCCIRKDLKLTQYEIKLDNMPLISLNKL